MIIHRKDAKGEAGSSRMFSEHSRRRTGATGFFSPPAATKKTPFALFAVPAATKQTLCALCAVQEVRMSRAQGCARATAFAVRFLVLRINQTFLRFNQDI